MSKPNETVNDVAAEIRNDIENLEGLTEGLAKSYLARMLAAHDREMDDGTHDFDNGYNTGAMKWHNLTLQLAKCFGEALKKFCADYCDGSCLDAGRSPNYCKVDCRYKDVWAAVNALEKITMEN